MCTTYVTFPHQYLFTYDDLENIGESDVTKLACDDAGRNVSRFQNVVYKINAFPKLAKLARVYIFKL